MAQRVGRGIAILFHDRGSRRGRVVSSTPRPHFTPEKDPVPNFTGGWVGPRAGLDGGKSRPHRDSIPDRPASNQSLYRLSYPAHYVYIYIYICINLAVCLTTGPKLLPKPALHTVRSRASSFN